MLFIFVTCDKLFVVMINYQRIILNNNQFKSICNQVLNCNSFLFESCDEEYLENFSYCFAKYLYCLNDTKKPCNECINCKKIERLTLADLVIYPKNNKTILVDDVKDLVQNANLTPIESNLKVFIFNNFASANTQAQNKLLKILEEPPHNTYIILNVGNINKVLSTVSSRCKKIRLKKLTNDEINNNVNWGSITKESKNTILSLADGNLTKAINYSSNPEFLQIFNDVIYTLTNLKDSKQLLKYSSKFNKSKKSFEYALEIFEAVFRDVLLIRLNKQNLIQNTHLITELKMYANFLDADALYKLIKKIYEVKKQLEFNCNFVLLVDNFLLYYLEVKFLCNKK